MRFTRWDQEMSSDDTNKVVSDLALRHLSLVGHEDGTKLSSYVTARDYRALCAYEPNYSELHPEDAANIRQALGFFTKRKDLDIGVDPREVAKSKFEAAEELCRQTNELIKAVASGKACLPPYVNSVLYAAQRKIARILGPVPKLSDLSPKFGPGATTKTKKRDASSRSKLGERFACSEELAPIASCCLRELARWSEPCEGPHQKPPAPVEIHTGKLAFVRKTAKTDRCIVVEPILNGMFQIGIGRHLQRRLLRWGVDISDQSKNKHLARLASVSGALATLDLSSASDTIALELVYDLLPIDWAHFLSRFRTGSVRMPDGSILKLQKFSSMGNGFTFPLETLIFYALAHASCEGDELQGSVSVYGDDIIVPSTCYSKLVRVLTTVGFIPNPDKSFSTGHFRESCGGDYLYGMDIRPFYLKGPLSGEAAFVLHNFYARRGLLEFSAEVIKVVDPIIRIYGPDGYGDGHLLGVHRRSTKPKHVEQGWSGYIFDTFTKRSRYSVRSYAGDYVLPSYSVYADPPPGGLWDAVPTTNPRKSDFLRLGRQFTLRLTARSSGGVKYRQVDGKALLEVVNPGSSGYKRISVYTLGT